MSESPTVLITLGRLPVALETARALHASGCRVVIADPWALNLCRVSNAVSRTYRTVAPNVDTGRYLAEIDAIARRERACLIVPLSEETLFVSRLSGNSGPPVFSGGFQHTRTLHDKLLFMQRAAALDLRCPATCRDLSAFDKHQPLVIKPRYSCGGRGLRFVANAQNPALASSEIAQQRIYGVEYSVLCIARRGSIHAMSCYRSELRDGAVAIAFESASCPSAEDWSSAFVSRTEHSGFIAFDFIVDNSGVAWPIECNPRVTSGIHLLTPESISAAILGTDSDRSESLPIPRRMEFYSCFTQLFSAILRRQGVRKTFTVLRSHRDVSWSSRDPLPFLLMMVLNWRLLWRVLQRRESFAQASVADLEWRPHDA